MLFDEFATRTHILTHQHGKDLVGLGSIVDCDLFQCTHLGTHRCFPKLVVVHLTQTFVALGVDGILIASTIFENILLPLLIVPAVFLIFAILAFINPK